MIQARSAYPKPLAYAVCKALGIKPPRIFVQVWDKNNRRWKTGAVDL